MSTVPAPPADPPDRRRPTGGRAAPPIPRPGRPRPPRRRRRWPRPSRAPLMLGD